MSKISNLHSLLSSKWLIEGSAKTALMPDFIRLLQGKEPIAVQTVQPGYYNITGDYWDEDDFDEDEEKEQQSYVATLPIKGPITKYTQWCGPMGTRTMREKMDRWKNDDSIVAVLLDIDSGGGQVSGTAEFADYIKNYSKPVIAYSDGQLCSAAYWLASAANEIIVNEFADEIGSIGTMASGVILDGVIKKAGGEIFEEYATKSTKKNNVWRELKNGNIEPLIKEALDPINERFIQTVKSYRPQLSEAVLNGVDFNDSKTSLKEGLVDKIGTKEDAINQAFSLAKNPKKSNQLNNPDMSKNTNTVTLVALAAVLGVEKVDAKKANIFSAEETVSLNIDQLQAIEDALNANKSDETLKTQISELKNELKKSRSETDAEKAKVTALDTAVNHAIDKAGLTAEKKSTTAENVNFLAEKVVEYGGEDGDTPTSVHSTGDKSPTKNAFVDEIAKKVDTTNI